MTWVPPVPDGRTPVAVQWVSPRGLHFVGSTEAKVTVVGFGDYACPDCRRGEQVVAALLQEFGEVRYAYCDHDVTGHEFGAVARRIAAVAWVHHRGWEAHQRLLGDCFRALKSGDETELLAELGIGYREFEARERATAIQAINHGHAEALGVGWAPTYFVNGVPLIDADPEHFRELVHAQLALASQVDAGLGVEALYRELARHNGADVPEFRPTWHIVGYEVVGYLETPREAIVAGAPLELGSVDDGPLEPNACDEHSASLELAAIHCSVLRYSDASAYLVMQVVEPAEREHLVFRAEPSSDVGAIPEDVRSAFEELEATGRERFERGAPPRELSTEGFLDYADPEMHAQVLALNELVPSHRNRLLELVEYHADPIVRGTAATLLNWAGQPLASIARVHLLLDDPSSYVRNNISRFMLHYVAESTDAELRRAVIDSLLVQIRRATMTDQNKALHGLMALARSSTEDRRYILERGGDWLRTLADQSVLRNVGGTARALLTG